MELVKFADAPLYTAPGPQQVVARRLQGGEASKAGFALVGHSSFPDRAVVPMSAGAFDRVYVVTEGALTIEQDGGTRHILHVGDSIFISAGEARAVINESGRTAAMIVVTPAPTS